MVWFLVVAKLGKTHLILLSFCIFQRLPKFGGLLKWTSVNSACLLKFEGGGCCQAGRHNAMRWAGKGQPSAAEDEAEKEMPSSVWTSTEGESGGVVPSTSTTTSGARAGRCSAASMLGT